MDEFLKLMQCYPYRLMSGHLLDMNSITTLPINAHIHTTFFIFPPAVAENLTLKDSKTVQEEEQKEIFVAFARVYSSAVKKGQRVFVLGPKYDPARGLSLVSPKLSITHKYMTDMFLLYKSNYSLLSFYSTH